MTKFGKREEEEEVESICDVIGKMVKQKNNYMSSLFSASSRFKLAVPPSTYDSS